MACCGGSTAASDGARGEAVGHTGGLADRRRPPSVSFGTTLYGPVSTLFAVEKAARDAGYGVSVASLRHPGRAGVLDAVDRLVAQSVEGILVIAPERPVARALRYLPPDLPLVAVQVGAVAGHPTVGIDQIRGAREATAHRTTGV